MKRLVLYHSPYSPFSRSVLLFCRFLKFDVEVKEVDLMEEDQMEPEFLKINPQHCVPTIDDDGFYLWESRAILSYLMETKAPHMLPNSPEERAVINQRLFFELGGLGKKYQELYRPLFENETEIEEIKIKELYEIFGLIDEHYLSHGKEWIAGEKISVADFAFVSTVAGLVATGASLTNYPRLQAWYKRCSSTFPEFKSAIEEGAQLFGDWVKAHETKGF